MRSGPMRSRITIYAQPATQDGFGQQVSGDPTAFLTCWASINTATSREIYALGPGFTSQVTHKIVIRYQATRPTAGMTISYADPYAGITRTFDIQAVSDPTERGRELDLMALETTK